MARTTTQLDTVVIYDDERAQRRSREASARAVCEALAEDGVIAGMPTIVPTAFRQDTLQAVAEGGQTLLLADLMAHDDSPRGARLLRAISAREDVAPSTWRIALTRLADPRVAARLQGHTDAVVVYDDTDIAPIAQAITAILAAPPAALARVETYPNGIEQRYPHDLDKRLRAALHGDYTAADAEAAFRWIGSTRNEITPETDTNRTPGFSRTSELLPRVEQLAKILDRPADTPSEIRLLQQKLKRRSPGLNIKQIYARVHEQLWSVSPAGLNETVSPDAVTFVMQPDNVALAQDWGESRESTWLTQAEHEAAWTLIRHAHRALEQHRRPPERGGRRKKTGTGDARLALNEVLRAEELTKSLNNKGLDVWDAHYAVCSLVDWLIDLEDQNFATIGEVSANT